MTGQPGYGVVPHHMTHEAATAYLTAAFDQISTALARSDTAALMTALNQFTADGYPRLAVVVLDALVDHGAAERLRSLRASTLGAGQ